MSFNYTEYLTSDAWRRLAGEAKARAGYECILCASSSHLEVHHRTYARIGRERLEDLIVLCWQCHRRHHGTLRSKDVHQIGLFAANPPQGVELN